MRSRRHTMVLLLVALALGSAALPGCGQKGPLYLPDRAADRVAG